MCGIAGMIGGGTGQVESMVDSIRHRGPDERGIYSDGVILGSARLSIVDIEGGRQPISNEDGSVWVVFNGEIYNFQHLRDGLMDGSLDGVDGRHTFETSGDTEVIVHLYEEFGEAFVTRLEGMFAIALWDVEEDRLLLYRDRLGIKPLYYTKHDPLVFASEPEALLEAGLDPRPDKEALSYFWNLDYIPAPYCAFESVGQLRPGSFLRVEDGDRSEHRYWKAGPARDVINSGEQPLSFYVERIADALEAAVEKRLIADVPVGAYLSGGLDSSTIVALMSELQPDPVRTYSVAFEDVEHDESEFSRLVAEHFETDHTEYTVKLDDAEAVDSIIRTLGEPLADPAVIPTYLLSEQASRDIKVVCTGEGADELFGGYDRYPLDLRYWQTVSRVPDPLLRMSMAASSHVPEKSRWERYLTYFGSMTSQIDAYAGTRLTETADMLEFENESEVKRLVASSFDPDEDYLRNMTGFDIDVWLPGDLLAKVDRTTMRNSLEARVPYLDHELVELSLAIPSRYKIRNGVQKYVLRESVRDRLPQRVLNRPKDAFNVPIARWLRDPDSPLAHHFTPEELGRIDDLVDVDRVLRGFERFRRGNDRYTRVMWKVLCVKLWHDEYVE